jgi:ankyrin repeat protein
MFRQLFSGLFLVVLCIHNGIAQPDSASDSIKNLKLFQVIRTGDTTALNRSLADGASANGVMEGYSALMAAALSGSIAEMNILIAHGADINFVNADSVTALWLAVPDFQKTVLLLNAGANPQISGKGGYTPIVKLALTPESAPLMKLFIEKGAILKKSAPNNSLMYNAALTNDTAMLGICIRAGLSLNDTTSFNDRPLIACLYSKRYNNLKMLVEAGADVNLDGTMMVIKNNYTPLMLAALSGDRQSVIFLLNHGANPNKKSPLGMTALMFAMQSDEDDPEITRLLLDHGVDPSEKMPDGSDALYFAEKRGNTESVILIKSQLNKNLKSGS